MELKMYFLTSSILFQKDSSYKCQFRTNVCAPPSLVSQVSLRAKYKDEVPDVSGSIQIIETS